MTHARWWRGEPDPRASVLLFCLPHAGAGAAAYRGWQEALGAQIAVQAVQLPGREMRIREDPRPDPAATAAAIAQRADRPFAIFGHSLGARLGFEVVRELRRSGGPMPVRLFVSGARPPHLPVDREYSLLADDEFLTAIEEMEGMPPGVLQHEELRELALPVLRADLEWLELYRLGAEAPLPMPIIGLCGSDDPLVTVEMMEQWTQHTAAGYRQLVLRGGHFFLDQHLSDVVGLIRDELSPPHRVALGVEGWQVWREALLRTAGFPADGLEGFSTPDAAKLADGHLSGQVTEDEFTQAFALATAENSRFAHEIALNPLVREAVTWQNPGAMVALDGVARGGPDERRNHWRRNREQVIARYWQRYCAKNETVGFFGPICWITVDPDGAQTEVRPGPALTRDRMVFLEYWAVAALARTFIHDPVLRACLSPVLRPHLVLDGATVQHPTRQPTVLSRPQVTAVALCDGERTAQEVAEALIADPASGLRRVDDVYLLLERLADQEVLIWDFDLPMRYTAEETLRAKLIAIGAPAAVALAKLEELAAAKRTVQEAAAQPERLLAALEALDAKFVELTGEAARRRDGQTYAGRTLCHEETTRDLDVVLGQDVFAPLAEPLGILLQASRWLTSEVTRVYTSALTRLYRELATDLSTSTVPLGQLWFLAQGLLFGAADRPADAVCADFVARWARLFGLGQASAGTSRMNFTSKELAHAVGQAFPAGRAGWSLGRVHSPDLHLCAPGGQGEFSAVLGEMHTAWATFDTAIFLAGHPDPARLLAAMKADLGAERIMPLYPVTWPRTTGRVTRGLDNETDWELCFDDAPGANRPRHLPIGSLSVSEVDGVLMVTTAEGRTWPLLEVLAELLSLQAVDAFKLVAAADHTPRITIDRLVVARESWRTSVQATGLTDAADDRLRYLAARRWRQELGLPEQVFVKVATETKPFYVDLTSPLYAATLCAAMRSARKSGGDQTAVVVTEMLPTPDLAWVPDAEGRRYFSELRLQIVDQEEAR